MLTYRHLLTVLLLLPLAGSLALLPLRDRQHLWIRRISLAVGLLEFVLSFIPVYSIPPGSSGLKFEEFVAWIPQLNINYHVGVDGISIFLIQILLLELCVIGVLISLDLFFFFFWWEFGLIPLALLIGIWGHGRRTYT